MASLVPSLLPPQPSPVPRQLRRSRLRLLPTSPPPHCFHLQCRVDLIALEWLSRLDDSIAIFHFFFCQNKIISNVVSYNILINAFCDSMRVDEDLEIYKEILESALFSSSPVTYKHLTTKQDLILLFYESMKESQSMDEGKSINQSRPSEFYEFNSYCLI
ncbi:Pentatricopeptide repeat-containing protein [Carex littledalei]|uniref:Pentatricopeptide repeat-containing protein n=1 Tax=Carex littledalei TaxID=544730 RepID=A0A833VHB0_9POAL|nr:Pentatricopeptide repeat-containing protein [Carex littledalei]